MTRILTAAGVAAALALGGCTAGAGPKEGAGTLIGAAGGAAIGSQIGSGTGRVVATAIGTLAGAAIGSEVGRSLDRADQMYLRRTTQSALERNPTGQSATWRNPDSGNYGSVTPERTYENTQGQPCREYQQTVTIGGETQQAYGTACRQSDGTWRIVNN